MTPLSDRKAVFVRIVVLLRVLRSETQNGELIDVGIAAAGRVNDILETK